MTSRFILRPLLVFLLFTQGVTEGVSQRAPGQGSSGVLYGRWTATAGPSQIFRGTWSAEISPRNANEAQGSWTLVNDSGEVTLEGTWLARKTGSHWRGTWRARTSHGRLFSGSWDAHLPDSKNQTFADLLKRTVEEEVAGFWQSGGYQGNWWLTGLKEKKGTR
jgi:hypothetical protein